MRKAWLTLIVTASLFAIVNVHVQGQKPLEIYFVDVEGGQATLFVSPAGESMLMDTGNPGGRDSDRILAAAKDAGIKQIDHLVISHFHGDHIGGTAEIAARLPIRNFVDYGSMVETGERAQAVFKTYADARAKGRHVLAKPGEMIPISGLNVQIVAADHQVVAKPLPGGGPNALCSDFTQKDEDRGENGRSVGIMVRHGRFSLLDLGDLTWNYEHALVCPNNRVGTVDVYLTTHHGLNLSGPRVLVHAVRPRVAIMNNGPRKGASREAWTIVKTSPGLEDLWQLHYSEARPPNPGFQETTESGGKDLNVPDQLIANLDETTAHFLKISARQDGGFTVTNPRTSFRKDYKPRN
jgi:beta-lactamase superfamily II metal-dependent hydrolase